MTTTTLYASSTDSTIFERGLLTYAQVPFAPVYAEPPFSFSTIIYDPIPTLFFPAPTTNGTSLNTNGTVFDGVPGYSAIAYQFANGNAAALTPTTFFAADANTGYAGFTNYTVNFDDLDISNLTFSDLATIEESLAFEPLNSAFPALDTTAGVTIAFDLSIAEEVSAANRAGFSIVAVSSNPSQEIELGFKTGGSDRVVALSENFIEAEDSSATPLDFSQRQTIWLSMNANQYSLSVNGAEVISGNLRNYSFDPTTSDPALPPAANPYETANFLFFGDNTDQAFANFTLDNVLVQPLQTPLTDNLLDDYIASHPDLVATLGYNLLAAKVHYINNGFIEKRAIDTFAEERYLASHIDLISTFGYDLDLATRHYIEFGAAEGRALNLFDPDLYLAGYADLQAAFGNDAIAATRHYIEFGAAEGRDPLTAFDGSAYIASYDDLIATLGNNPVAGLEHYRQFGAAEGRTITFEADDYIASHGDLITTLAYNLQAGIEHFIRFGSGEGRSRDTFDEGAYLAKYPDLQRAFGDDTEAATRHYIESGFTEGRTI
jgi:hypothetical protein